jgi:rhomboid family GlyGly-CTERM serine protease
MIPGARADRNARGWPWIILGIVAIASVVALVPGVEGALEFDRSAIRAGEAWRLLTGQIVHWTPRMAVADLGVLLAVGAWLERRSRRLARTTLLTGALLSGAGLYWLAPNLALYRGSSSLASALFVASALALAARASGGRERIVAIGVLGLFAGKLLWELETGQALAAGALLPGVTVTPLAHLLGGLAGLLAILLRARPALVRILAEKV